MPDRYAVLGQPIEHTLSPKIHQLFAEQLGLHIVYEALEVSPADFVTTVLSFRQSGGKGVNVTVPHKQSAYQLATQHDEAGTIAAAVNTLWFDKDDIMSANTDGVGLFRDLTQRHGVDIQDQSILLLGAGGAARGVIHNILLAKPKSLHIANRTESKAIEIQAVSAANYNISASDITGIPRKKYSLIINATSASLSYCRLDLSKDILSDSTFCYDMVYASRPTVFLQWAAEHGAKGAADGLGMLVEQAAEAFRIWRGVLPDTDLVYKQLTHVK